MSRSAAWGALALFLIVAGAAAAPATPAAPDGVALRTGARAVFATAAAGMRLLSTRDGFVDRMSAFDRAARLKIDRVVTPEELLAFAGRQVREWTAADKARLGPIFDAFRSKTVRLTFDLPPEIAFVKTTGEEEGHAAYCRGATVVLPESILAKGDAELATTVFHELFHVYSTHNPGKRAALYRIIGFAPGEEIPLPPALQARKITNPDAPRIDSVIRVTIGGRTVPATPVLYASTERYDAAKGADFFESLVFRLMLLDERDGRFTPADLPDAERLVDPRSVPSYLDQVGRNTGYILHPEEILADNFVILITGKTPVPTPRVVDELGALLSKK